MDKVKRIKWTDEKIESGIREIMNSLYINRMPTRTEVIEIMGNNTLGARLCRDGGYRCWANRLGLDVQENRTNLGLDYEYVAKQMLEDKFNYKVEKMTTRYPYDLLVNDAIKVDVKVGKPNFIKTSRVHTFGLHNRYSSCDLFIIFALEESGDIEKTLIIPGHELNVTTLCIGKQSRYDVYSDRWDYFGLYDNFYKKISS